MVDGRGEVYLGTLWLGCFSRVAAGIFWVLLLMYRVHRRITHRRVCHVHDSSVVNDLVVVCVQDQRDGDFFLLGWTAQGPASCRVVSGGRSGVLGAAMLLRCRGL